MYRDRGAAAYGGGGVLVAVREWGDRDFVLLGTFADG